MELLIYLFEVMGAIGLIAALVYICANYICTNL